MHVGRVGHAIQLSAGSRRAYVDPIKATRTLDGPFVSPAFPQAAREALGFKIVPAEMAFGTRMAAAQLPLVSGWLGSAASLSTALLVVIPLLKLRPLAVLLQAGLSPCTWLLTLLLSLIDEAVILLVAAIGSIIATAGSALIGLSQPVDIASAFEVGPRLIAGFMAALRSSRGLQISLAAFNSFLWSPIKVSSRRAALPLQPHNPHALQSQEEVVFRLGLQRGLALAIEQRKGSSDAASDSTRASAIPSDWRLRVSELSRRRARLAAAVIFGLSHLPAPGPPATAYLLAIALPRAVSAGLSAYFCLGYLYERRGLPASVGAHIGHNLMVSCLHMMQGRQSGLLHRAGLGVVAPAVPAVIYANTFIRRQNRLRQANQQPAINKTDEAQKGNE